ncbi:MAG: DNA-3-methyladenine glycosylase [Methylacidiphilales bacterium]|nr:DNA-3-methyladenine glycosylase [Candidatus Methylacidiphilales bacterium]MDW8348900.1 DNA-3-methyladenine glycosylase [Verrucomicrobiae bacterium]
MGKKISREVYQQENVVELARFFLGKYIVSVTPEGRVGGWIIETEAYGGEEDLACHAAGGRRTSRTEIMYRPGGVAYVYLCYGLHHMLNFVTGPRDVPCAVLLRGVKIEEGEAVVKSRRRGVPRERWGIGPGCVTKALGVTIKDNGVSLTGTRLWIEDRGVEIPDAEVCYTPRIGVDYAGEIWSQKPWRMVWRGGLA